MDIVFIYEQYRDKEGVSWYSGVLGTAAIWICSPHRFQTVCYGSGSGFVWVKGGGVTYVSYYLTPNEEIGSFQEKLDALEDVVRDVEGELIVAGDFNAKALEWGEPHPDSGGRRVMDMASRLGLLVLNTGTTSTFRRPGCRKGIIDVSFETERLVAHVRDWQVIEDYTASDHQFITFRVRDVTQVEVAPRSHCRRCNVDKMNTEKLAPALERGQQTRVEIPDGTSASERESW